MSASGRVIRLTHCFIDVALRCRIFGTTSPELTDYIGLVHIIIDNVDDSLKRGSIYTLMKKLRTNTERARRMRRLREIGRCSSLYPRRYHYQREFPRQRAPLSSALRRTRIGRCQPGPRRKAETLYQHRSTLLRSRLSHRLASIG